MSYFVAKEIMVHPLVPTRLEDGQTSKPRSSITINKAMDVQRYLQYPDWNLTFLSDLKMLGHL